ncbi:MAG TPA: replicative DNA helicase, partial [Actinomycetota bacterium]|nr:replicative DNA helicase [Actinomycetota bacterium]
MAQRLEAVRPNRIPPHNLDAEQSVLGAMLESKEAIANVVDILHDGNYFYKPTHGDIFEAIMALYGKGEAVDAITVADELARSGKLEQIGGKPYIHGLLEAYPTAASAGHYARIVEELALLRRLIEAGGGVQEIGFSMPEDVAEALNEAEELVFNVGDRRLKDQYHEIRKLLMQSMKDIEKLYERGANLTGLASGFPDLDDMTAGFQQSNLIIVAARPSMGKCLSADSLIDDPQTGQRLTIREFVEARRPEVFNVSPRGELSRAEVVDWVPNGTRECFRVTTRSGRTIEATANHPFMKVAGWTPLADLSVGDRVAVPRALPTFGDGSGWTSDKARLLGYLIAEGGLTGSMPRFTNCDDEIVGDFKRCTRESFPGCDVSGPIGITYTCRAVKRSKQKNDVTKWLVRLGLMGKSALEKRFPNDVWTFDRSQLSEFMRALFSCDATVYPMSGYARIEFAVASEGLAQDVHHALLRFGIVSKLWRKSERCWRVEITEPRSVDTYQREIGWIGEKSSRSFETLRRNRRRSNLGHLPIEIWDYVKKACEREGVSLCELGRRAGDKQWSNPHVRRGLPQWRLSRYAQILNDGDLRALASEDLYWDEIVSIESVGEREVFDLTVPEGSNFVAQDFFVHNSSLMNDFVLHAALKEKTPVIIFSLEMSKEEVVKRFLSSEAKVDAQRINKGALQETDWTRLSAALGRLGDAPIFVDDSANITLMEMRAKCRRLKAKHGLGMVVIDYLQLMQSPRKSENRQQEVTEISRNLKILARELKVPVVCASQLNRGVEMRSDKRPLLGDLRESGSIEQDADVVMFIYRD